MDYTLTVVIPNYNNSGYLPQCVESIVAQTYEKLVEILIVDDCSTDNSREVILALADAYPIVKPVLLEKNGKVSAARNAGLMRAVGEYITFVDADDFYYNPDKLKNEMELICKYRETGIDVVAYSSIVWVSNDGKEYMYPQISRKHYLEGNVYRKLLLDVRSSVVMRDYCVRTELVRAVGGYTIDNSLFEDFELLLKLAVHTPFYFTGEHGTAYRDSVAGLSKKPRAMLVNAKKTIINNQIKNEPFVFRTSIRVERFIINALKSIRRMLRG